MIEGCRFLAAPFYSEKHIDEYLCVDVCFKHIDDYQYK